MGLGSTVSSSGALAQVSGRDSWKATACNNNNNAKNALGWKCINKMGYKWFPGPPVNGLWLTLENINIQHHYL